MKMKPSGWLPYGRTARSRHVIRTNSESSRFAHSWRCIVSANKSHSQPAIRRPRETWKDAFYGKASKTRWAEMRTFWDLQLSTLLNFDKSIVQQHRTASGKQQHEYRCCKSDLQEPCSIRECRNQGNIWALQLNPMFHCSVQRYRGRGSRTKVVA